MKISPFIVVALTTCLFAIEVLGQQKEKRNQISGVRRSRQLNNKNADQMVQNILQWLQDVYGSQGRRSRSFMIAQDLEPPYYFASARIDRNAFRQGTLREYLPPTPGEKPRPFTSRPSTDGAGIDEEGNFVDSGYPPAGITPQPPFTLYTNPATGGITGIGSSGIPGEQPTGPGSTYYPTQSTGVPGYTSYTGRPGYTTVTPEVTERPKYPGYETPLPEGPEVTPGKTVGISEATSGYPTPGLSAETQGYSTSSPSGFTGYPSGRPTAPSTYIPPGGNGYPTFPTSSPSGFTGYPSNRPSGFPTGYPTNRPASTETSPTALPTRYPSGRPSTELPSGQSEFTGYPTPSPTGFPTVRPPSYPATGPTGYPTGPAGYPTGPIGYPTGVPTSTPGYQSGPTGYPTEAPNGTPGYQTGPTGYPAGAPNGTPGYQMIPTGYPNGVPTGTPGYQTGPTGYPSGVSTGAPGYSMGPTGYPSGAPTFPPAAYTTGEPSFPSVSTTGAPSEGFPTLPPSSGEIPVSETEKPELPVSTEGFGPGFSTSHLPGISTGIPGEGIEPTESTENEAKTVVPSDEDLKHPPHIHALDVQCAKDMMTINIEFNREFNGIIYSKGYYNMPECRYVNENSGQTKYTFTVNLNMCGTEFVNAFDTEGQSYLENILVLQNEEGIQEVWDTVRSVRCLWEGNLKEQLSVTLMVGMLSQEIVTFSGDTAMAKLDVLLGRGPFGQAANGLVKIGEPMTLVVSVSGDPGFDVQVKDCRATDSSGTNIVPLTDDNGCILKPKLFGSFQKTRNTGETGASIIAYAYFNAFKFPDVMDIMIECNIELCKTDCEMCTDPNPQLEPGKRRKRDLYAQNETLHDGMKMSKHLRVVLAEDLATAAQLLHEGVCMSTENFVYSSSLLITLLTGSCLLSVYLWFSKQKLRSLKQ